MLFATHDLYTDELSLELLRTAEAGSGERWIKYYEFDIRLADGTHAGHCDLRLGVSEKLLFSGNIGYTIFEEYRGRRYAAKACLLLFEQARKHDVPRLYITCAPENEASRRTCEFVGARLVTIADLPPDSDRYRAGQRRVCIYRADL